MSTIGDRLGDGARPDLGVGVSIAPKDLPQEEDIIHKGWQHGLMVSESPENIPKDAAQTLTDMDVNERDALTVAPGVSLNQDVTPRLAKYIFQQTSIDYSTELVIIDPPYLGVKSVGTFTFYNLALGASTANGWATAVVLGTLIFSDGTGKTYTRAAGAVTVTDISADIVAQCFGTAFGRVFAGGYVDPISGYQALGVRWNAANGSLTDWSGLGSGSEFLISNNPEADRVVAMVSIGLQTLGVLCRKSLWVGYQTGQADSPADFQMRFLGLGCVWRDTAVATPWGIIYLSDDGVCLFDLNSVTILSHPIDPLLIPLDYSRISNYSGKYDQSNRRYILTTPFGTWIYQFPPGMETALSIENIPGRWFFRSLVADSVAMFTDQGIGVYWDTVIGQWNQQTLTWVDMVVGEENVAPRAYFTSGTKVGVEDPNVATNFGTALTPVYKSRQDLEHVTDLVETHWIEVQYISVVPATVQFSSTDTAGGMTNSVTKTLPSTNGVRSRVLIGVSTMLGIGTEFQVQITSGNCQIERIRRVVLFDGPSIAATL